MNASEIAVVIGVTPESVQRLEIAKRVVNAHIPYGLEAAYLTGSSAEGIADSASDIDMGLFFPSLPPEPDLIAARESLDPNQPKWILGSYEEGEFAVSISIDGVETQYGVSPTSIQDRYVDELLVGKYLKGPEQKIAMGTLFAIPLHGDEIVSGWQARFRDYPDSVARAMIESHRPARAIGELYPKIAGRDCELWQRRELVDLAYNICGMLAGLNRKWHSDFQFKRMHRFCESLQIAPTDLAERLLILANGDIPTAARVGQDLLDETLRLIEGAE